MPNEQEQEQQQEQEGDEQQQQLDDERGSFRPPQSPAELNELIQARIERERAKFADAVAKAAEYDKLKESEKTETQRLSDSLAEAERRRQDVESELQRVRLDRAIETKALALGFVDPEAATKLVDRDAVTVGDDGKPDAAAVESALKSLLDDKPYLRSTKAVAGKADQGVRGGGSSNGSSGGEGSNMDELLRRAVGKG